VFIGASKYFSVRGRFYRYFCSIEVLIERFFIYDCQLLSVVVIAVFGTKISTGWSNKGRR